MSVDDKRLAAAFFLPGTEDATVADLLVQIGATDIAEPLRDSSDPSGLVDCRWAGLAAKGFLDSRLGLHLLCVFFFQSSFLDLVPGWDDPPSEHRSDRFVDAFAQACDALCPIVALVVTHLHEADIDALWALAPAVLEQDVDRLARARFGLLFVNDTLGTGAWYGADRDWAPTACGELVFAGTGPRRWW